MSEEPDRIYFTRSYFEEMLRVRTKPSASGDIVYVRADIAERYRVALEPLAKCHLPPQGLEPLGVTAHFTTDEIVRAREALHPTQPAEGRET